LTAVSRAVRRIIELTGTHEVLAVEREPRNLRSNFFLPNGPDATHPQKCMNEGCEADGYKRSRTFRRRWRKRRPLTKDLRDVPRLSALLPKVLDGALSLMGADFGNLQILDVVTGSLRIVTQAGFGPEFLDYFAMVADHHSACARAARHGAQWPLVLSADVRE
jgi:hypothetical protein